MTAYSSVPHDRLIAGMVQPIVTESIVIKTAAGATFKRGAVLARTGFEADGTWICTIVNSTSVTELAKVPVAILADDEVDATTADVRATCYTQGEFNRKALIFGGTDTIITHEAALNNAKIYTKRVVE